ncbi:MAG: FHA domain-containing protein [Myxococcales bacterium]|nr:FHA domain-containing protein [Myxococcales bacterium]
MPGRLRETEGPNSGALYELKDVCILGRALDCHVHIRDLTVSRRHARISAVEGRYILEDLGSGNGTFVNGRAITRHQLRHDDQIRVCSAHFRFEEVERATDSVTMVSAPGRGPRIVKTVDAAQSILQDASSISEASSPKDLLLLTSRLKTVYAISEAISNLLDPDELLTVVLDRLFDVFPRAQRGFVMLRGRARERLVPRVVKRRNERDAAELTLSRTILHEVMARRHAVLSHDASEDQRFNTGRSVANYGIRAMVAAPLIWRDDALGIVYLDSPGIAAFEQADLELLTGIARQAAAALGNARLHDELMKRKQLERDLLLAERIQQSFLPRRIPRLAGFTFCARYEPAYEIGGDFYDFVPLPDDKLAIVVATSPARRQRCALHGAADARPPLLRAVRVGALARARAPESSGHRERSRRHLRDDGLCRPGRSKRAIALGERRSHAGAPSTRGWQGHDPRRRDGRAARRRPRACLSSE